MIFATQNCTQNWKQLGGDKLTYSWMKGNPWIAYQRFWLSLLVPGHCLGEKEEEAAEKVLFDWEAGWRNDLQPTALASVTNCGNPFSQCPGRKILLLADIDALSVAPDWDWELPLLIMEVIAFASAAVKLGSDVIAAVAAPTVSTKDWCDPDELLLFVAASATMFWIKFWVEGPDKTAWIALEGSIKGGCSWNCWMGRSLYFVPRGKGLLYACGWV